MYISYNLGDWANQYHCAIFAYQTAWQITKKMFVPQYFHASMGEDEESAQNCIVGLWWDGDGIGPNGEGT
jgi:hypothetical protein